MIGKTLGHYQITSQLGKGGMGEVYQASDQKLGRNVAIKVLPEEFAKDADRVARFQREAKLLASLNHPNIAAIYGLEEAGGTNFLVLELVEGETLADQIKKAPIPVEESLKLALQIAEALEAAHEKGVIHRDLKPANIKVTPDGKVKVLDFGLAKAFAGEQAELNLSNSPTLSDAATQQGVILGTAAYMSPEQARGKSVDKRTDIWAFGCVLFEMLAGKPAFSGTDVTEILAAIIRAEPEWATLPATVHWRMREVIERCLIKDANNRYHDIFDVRSDLQRVLTDPSGVLAPLVPGAELRTGPGTMLPWLAALTILSVIIGGLAVWNLKPRERHPPIHFSYEVPSGQRFSNINGGDLFAVSPDGNQFIYGSTAGLYLRAFDQLDARLISGTEGEVSSPFFSPDGQWVGYWSFSENRLKKVAVNGGVPVPLTDDRPMGFLSWSTRDEIFYAGIRGIMRIPANGGTPETVIKAKDEYFFSPRILPDGKSITFTVANKEGSHVAVQSLDGEARRLLFAGTNAQYLQTGHLVFCRDHRLWAVPFSLGKLQPAGGPVPVVEGIYQTGSPQFAISDSGTLVYLPRTETRTNFQLVWVNLEGAEEKLNVPPGAYSNPSIAPDGTRVALQTTNEQIAIWDVVRENISPLTSDNNTHFCPLWTPDSRWIVFTRASGASAGIYRIASDAAGVVECLDLQQGWQLFASSWSSGSKALIGYRQRPAIMNQDLGILSMEGDRQWRSLLQQGYNETQPKMSPDGQYLAYASDELGQREVYMRSFPEIERERLKISADGGDSPLWSPGGRGLFYRTDDRVMAVAIETKPKLKAGKPRILFNGKYHSGFGHQWDIHPDGKRFLMIKTPWLSEAAPTAPRPRINIVLNWLEELKQRVPIK